MKYINKILLITLMTFVGYSCSDLEEDTSSLIEVGKIETENDITASVAPIYRNLLEMYKSPHFTRTATYGGDDITTWIAGNKAPLRVFDKFDYGSGENSDIKWLPHVWDASWQTIYFCNSLIEGLKSSTAPEDVIAKADAEARVFRALCYLNLVKIHGNMPLILDGDIPTGKEQRATVLENYQLIESDLLIAEEFLPIPGEEPQGRASAALAKSILADLYLTWAGWPVKDALKNQLAADKAKEIIDYNFYNLVPLEDLWSKEGGDSKEVIFSFKLPDDQSIVNGTPTAFSFHQARGFSDCFAEFQFFNDFPEGPRKDVTFLLDIPNRNAPGGVITPKDPATIPWQDSDRGHPMYKKYVLGEDLTFGNRPVSFRSVVIYRYAEILLIYAEAQARGDGQNGDSIEALNQVRRRAYPAGTPDLATATPNEIVDEKGWELAAENKRWYDLVRTERVAEMAAKRDPSEPVTLVRQPTEAQFIAPIPFASINLSELEQNPEGFKIR